jgi:hypothetical protein
MQLDNLFHCQEYRGAILSLPIEGIGSDQWLGDGYYFWQDYEFAQWWGNNKKCNNKNLSRRYSVYKASIEFDEDDFIDTVFNETDYRNFVKNIEKFANKYFLQFNKKPSLIEFNDFISDKKIWSNIKIIRFQDVPLNDDLMSVKGFYYKKRIQIRVLNIENITNFVLDDCFDCI